MWQKQVEGVRGACDSSAAGRKGTAHCPPQLAHLPGPGRKASAAGAAHSRLCRQHPGGREPGSFSLPFQKASLTSVLWPFDQPAVGARPLAPALRELTDVGGAGGGGSGFHHVV